MRPGSITTSALQTVSPRLDKAATTRMLRASRSTDFNAMRTTPKVCALNLIDNSPKSASSVRSMRPLLCAKAKTSGSLAPGRCPPSVSHQSRLQEVHAKLVLKSIRQRGRAALLSRDSGCAAQIVGCIFMSSTNVFERKRRVVSNYFRFAVARRRTAQDVFDGNASARNYRFAEHNFRVF